MASGHGVNGGPGRCYSFWLDFTKCLADADLPIDCKDLRDDYMECLHHKKEAQRRRAVAAELNRQRKEKIAAEASAKRKPDS
ncbi:NADH dehydrogenase [ubiquinone] iron-sulfur protein 5-B [Gracilariopsis chorda]|uniref:NADH dehydrogenase [ubiquinone] iron-sulfur protein 5 n=1 Tax=Gracilariopsis chorda TaxID=448386 RepID=A0A2V3IGC5_9FLOR|nr:NADH dehydrogenase [ubiquinone] iron-sulfur protein 5-B [Gracilariopsis chorda]|eukprot:PXF41073.1 NADH dehydrogenase [ubiquinone] iron-sulfur protein 5-B [Gracilariopsis chorda]